jgi:hypothetical protein
MGSGITTVCAHSCDVAEVSCSWSCGTGQPYSAAGVPAGRLVWREANGTSAEAANSSSAFYATESIITRRHRTGERVLLYHGNKHLLIQSGS